ncbi:MAG: hypothetical protein NTV21_18420 [Planctomycetota bacterium]|nr:hypothetical protein [Planctomycetota bacterium]
MGSLALGVVLVATATSAMAQKEAAGWGYFRFNSAWKQESFVAIDAAGKTTVARRADGRIVVWGKDNGHANLASEFTYVDMSAGWSHLVGLTSSGLMKCSGPGIPPCANLIPALGTTFTDVAAGGDHFVALQNDGIVQCAGQNNYGATDVPAGLLATAVDAGNQFTLALRTDGTIAAWGASLNAQTLVPSLPPGLTYVEISAGEMHSAARRSDGSVVCWGDNLYGQCAVPALPPGVTFVDVAAGGTFTVAACSDGLVRCWGLVPPAPNPPSGTIFVEVAAGDRHGVARASDGRVVCWGDNSAVQCNVPDPAPGLEFEQVAIAQNYSYVGLLSDGTVMRWGASAPSVPPLLPGTRYLTISSLGTHVAALRSDGVAVCWGDNSQGQSNVVSLPPGLSYVEVAAGTWFTAARRSDGAVICWGQNTYGECNVPALPPGVQFTRLFAGVWHTAALCSDGLVRCWGRNDTGQCNVPSPPAGLSYLDAGAGSLHTLGLLSDGTVVSWGQVASNYKLPAATAGRRYVDVDAGLYSSLGLLDDGTVESRYGFPYFSARPPLLPTGSDWIHAIARGDRFTGVFERTGFVTGYCTAGVTTRGCVPVISGNGLPSATSTEPFTITIDGADGGAPGLISYGINNAGFVPTPWGNSSSYACVRPPIQRTPLLSGGGNAGTCGARLVLNWTDYMASNPAALGQPLSAGLNVYAQGWCRDWLSLAGAVRTNAIQFVVQP